MGQVSQLAFPPPRRICNPTEPSKGFAIRMTAISRQHPLVCFMGKHPPAFRHSGNTRGLWISSYEYTFCSVALYHSPHLAPASAGVFYGASIRLLSAIAETPVVGGFQAMNIPRAALPVITRPNSPRSHTLRKAP